MMSWWMKAIIVIVVLVAGYAFYRGMWDVNDLKSGAKQAVKEVKSATGMKPNIKRGAGHAEDCRKNLRALESTKRQIADQLGTSAVSWEEVRKRFPNGVAPKCPDGGEYRLNTLGQPVSCSIGNNETLERDDDHQIAGF